MSDENLRLNEGQGKKVRTQINASMNDEDMEVLEELKRMFGTSTTAILKIALRKLLNAEKDAGNDHYTRTLHR